MSKRLNLTYRDQTLSILSEDVDEGVQWTCIQFPLLKVVGKNSAEALNLLIETLDPILDDQKVKSNKIELSPCMKKYEVGQDNRE